MNLDAMLQELVYRVLKQHDYVVEQCFQVWGFDREYLLAHAADFVREVHPELRETYYHFSEPLFTVQLRTEFNQDTDNFQIFHKVEFFRKEILDENGN